MSEQIENAARNYLEKGWVSIPIPYKGKAPRLIEWQKRTIKDVDPEKEFISPCNIGILMGEPSNGLVDIDLDCPEAVKVAPFLLPLTGLIFGRKSNPDSHYIYQVKDCGQPQQFKCSVSSILVEYRSTNQQTVFPPSMHEEGEIIEFSRLDEPARIMRADLLRAVKEVASAALISSFWREGSRHSATMALSGALLRAGWSEGKLENFIEAICCAAEDEEVKDRLKAAHTTAQRLTEGLDTTGLPTLNLHFPDEVVQHISLWLDLPKSKALVTPNSGNTTVYRPFTEKQKNDTANAQLFAEENRHIARYCGAQNAWFVFNGKYWAEDSSGTVIQLAQAPIRRKMMEASGEELKWLVSSLNDNRLRSMVKLAQHECHIDIEEFDREFHLFNCQNGTLDLSTGKLLPHNPKHLITKISPIAFDPSAKCYRWLQFLHEVMDGRENMVSFLQKAVGYTLTGRALEQCMFICTGPGRNGKSTFSNVISNMMGTYAKATPIDTLMVQRNSSVPNDLARLTGIRFVSANEGEMGQRLAEAKIKLMTGGEKVTARFMHSEFFEYTPQFKIWLGTNNLPEIKGNDEGIWRRIRVINFGVIIPENRQDKDLESKLKQELSGILTWAVNGCLAWQAAKGLNPPNEVLQAGKEYRSEMDTVVQFLEDCCHMYHAYEETTAQLYKSYSEWCLQNGEKPMSKVQFSKDLKSRGFDDVKIGRKRTRGKTGLKLIQEIEEIPDPDLYYDMPSPLGKDDYSELL